MTESSRELEQVFIDYSLARDEDERGRLRAKILDLIRAGHRVMVIHDNIQGNKARFDATLGFLNWEGIKYEASY